MLARGGETAYYYTTSLKGRWYEFRSRKAGVLAAAARLGSLRESLGDSDGARAAFERAAAAADELAANLPQILREIFEAKPDVAELRQRLMPA